MRGRERERERKGGRNRLLSFQRGKAKQRYVVRARAEFTWKFHTHLAKRAFRLVSFRETRLHSYVQYKHTGPSNQLREISLASFLRKLYFLAPPYAMVLLHFPPSSPLVALFLFASNIRPVTIDQASEALYSFRFALHRERSFLTLFDGRAR